MRKPVDGTKGTNSKATVREGAEHRFSEATVRTIAEATKVIRERFYLPFESMTKILNHAFNAFGGAIHPLIDRVLDWKAANIQPIRARFRDNVDLVQANPATVKALFPFRSPCLNTFETEIDLTTLA